MRKAAMAMDAASSWAEARPHEIIKEGVSEYFHEDEALGRAYDGRLMKRFLVYVRPYRGAVAVTMALLVARVATDLAGPLILKKAIDGPLFQRDFAGLTFSAALFMAVTRTIIRNLALSNLSPAEIIRRANDSSRWWGSPVPTVTITSATRL